MGLLTSYITKQRFDAVESYVTGDVLDLGCGPEATMYKRYKNQIESYSGVERKVEVVKQLQKQFPNATFFQRDVDIDNLDFNKKFDCIFLVALIEHVFNQKFLFIQIKSCLKLGGKIIITTPTPFGNDFVHTLFTKVGFVSKSAHDDHIVIYNKKRFEILAKEIGLRVEYYKQFELGCNQLVVLSNK